MSDIATKQEIIEDVKVENCEKYEYLDEIPFRKLASRIINENMEVLEALAK